MVFWDYQVCFAGDRASHPLYDSPNLRVSSHGNWMGTPGAHPFEVGAWRGPGANTNNFARESHADVMAAAAGIDPLSFRLAHLKDKQMHRVLEAAAERFGWSPAKAPSGKGHGIAFTDYLGSLVTLMAEVDVDGKTGKVRVKRVVCAQDMGEIINPEGAKMQIEGCITMGLGYVLSEEVHFKGGAVLDRNFDTYEIPRFSWLPQIDVVLVDNPDLPPQGCGEPAITCMGAAIANAVFDATGVRIYQLPLTPERVKKALSSK
jgi:CO/xanthine dehydrogenase Mo-binding subunit